MGSSGACARCDEEVESVLHCIRDCTCAKEIWTLLGFDVNSRSFQLDFRSWFELHCPKLISGKEGPKAEYLFVLGTWFCWKYRNEHILGDKRSTKWDINLNIRTMVEICFNAFWEATSSVPKISRLVGWVKPVAGTIKINTDGSALGNPERAGFGGVCRDEKGHWHCGFSGSIGQSTNMLAELAAIRAGLQIGSGMSGGNIVLETDSLEAIRLIEKENSHYHIYGAIIEDIQVMFQTYPRWRITHVLREGNQCADFMAKLGSSNDEEYVVWEDPPDGISLMLLADRISTLEIEIFVTPTIEIRIEDANCCSIFFRSSCVFAISGSNGAIPYRVSK
ncbi:ribonuclease H [Senna tora]|uniref:Ribonuclease H n=1 Tax=Senna tora TaxID=362788 RepID=A0A834WGK9_9FABA|nr:ribonuclease H [Senna tora]